MNEKATSTLHAPPPQKKPQVQPKFQVPLMPQPGFFPSMTLKACLAYANFWYAQAHVQTLAKHGQYPMPPSTTVAQPRAQRPRLGASPLSSAI